MEHLEALMMQLLLPDNEAIRRAETQINTLAKDAAVVPALLVHVRSSPYENVRQLAAVLMRKKITGHWMKLTPEVQESVKTVLLESIVKEPSSLVRRASADVVSIVAKHSVPAGQWPGLLPFLFECSQSLQEEHREVALILFSSLTETVGDMLRPQFVTLHAIFVSGLRDKDSNRVRVAALKAVGALLDWIQTEQEVLMFKELVPSILDVAGFCLSNGDEDSAIKAFEILYEFVERPAPLLGSAIPAIVEFALRVATNGNFEPNTRHQAVEIVSCLARYKPKTLVRHKLVVPILSVMCPMIAEPTRSDDDDDVSSAHRFAAQVVDTIAINLPKKHVYPPVLEFSKANAQSQIVSHREAAAMAMGVIAEGCSEVMRHKLDELLPLVLGALSDPEPLVRAAASFAIGQFAEHLQPEIVERYAEVLPAVFAVLADGEAGVREKGYYALDAFCEHLGDEILPYLEPLMGRLMEALRGEKRELQEICLSAVGSAAAAAEISFLPYTEAVLGVLKNFMCLEQDEDLGVRARATELVGIIGVAVGRQVIEPVLPGFMELALKGFDLDYTELREYSHGFFGNVADILQKDFVQYLPHVMPRVFASCDLDDGTVIDLGDSDDDDDDDNEADRTMRNGAIDGVSSDDESDDLNKGVRNLSIRTGVLDEKAAATQALGLFALHTKEGFLPYLEAALKVLKKHVGYFHEDVRVQAVISLQYMLTATQEAFPARNIAVDDGTVLPVAPEVMHVLDTVMELYIRAMEEDEDKEAVAQACMCIVKVMKSVGLAPVEKYLKKVSDAILDIIKQKALCQRHGDSDSDGDEEEDDAEHDDVLMDAATDVLPAMAALMGPSFEPVFREHFDPLTKFLKSSRPASDRTMVIACVAEVAKAIGPAIQPYIDIVMPVALKELRVEESANRRNAAFCAGMLCEHGGEKAVPYYQGMLVALHPLFQVPTEEVAVRDNAAGAVARMIITSPTSLPLTQVLPVFIGALPLEEDMEEAEVTYGCLCQLIHNGCTDIMPYIPQVVKIFGEAVTHPQLTEEVKAGIGSAVCRLYNLYTEQMQPVLNALPTEQGQVLARLMGRI